MIEIRWLKFSRNHSVHRMRSLPDILAERTVCIHFGRYNHSTFESVNVTKHAYIDHRQSWLSSWLPGTKVVRSTGGRIRNYYSLAVSGWEKERAGLRRMHHREQIPLPRLYFTTVVKYTWSAYRIRTSERESCSSPLILTWLPSVRLTVDQSIYLAWTLSLYTSSPPPLPFTSSSPSGCP